MTKAINIFTPYASVIALSALVLIAGDWALNGGGSNCQTVRYTPSATLLEQLEREDAA